MQHGHLQALGQPEIRLDPASSATLGIGPQMTSSDSIESGDWTDAGAGLGISPQSRVQRAWCISAAQGLFIHQSQLRCIHRETRDEEMIRNHHLRFLL
jgi:hypothetical protein